MKQDNRIANRIKSYWRRREEEEVIEMKTE